MIWSAEVDQQDLINRVHPEKDMGEPGLRALVESWGKLALEGLGLALFLGFVVLIVMRG